MLIYSDKDKYILKDHFFILPFRCDDCGKIFALEQGTIQKNAGYEMFDFQYGIPKYYKYCGICSKDEIVKVERS